MYAYTCMSIIYSSTYVCKRERDRQTETERERERQTDRDRETDRQTERTRVCLSVCLHEYVCGFIHNYPYAHITFIFYMFIAISFAFFF